MNWLNGLLGHFPPTFPNIRQPPLRAWLHFLRTSATESSLGWACTALGDSRLSQMFRSQRLSPMASSRRAVKLHLRRCSRPRARSWAKAPAPPAWRRLCHLYRRKGALGLRPSLGVERGFGAAPGLRPQVIRGRNRGGTTTSLLRPAGHGWPRCFFLTTQVLPRPRARWAPPSGTSLPPNPRFPPSGSPRGLQLPCRLQVPHGSRLRPGRLNAPSMV